MAELFSNNASTTIAGAVTSGAVTINVSAGDGAKFPSPSGGDYFRLFALNKSTGNWELMICTARAIDALTVTRGSESTTAIAFNDGDPVELRPTAATLASYLMSGEPIDGTEIGGTTPAAASVTSLSTSGAVNFYREGVNSVVFNTAYVDTANKAPYFIMRRARNTEESPEAVEDNDSLGRIGVRPHDGDGFPVVDLAEIRFLATEDHSSTDHGTEMLVYTTPKGSESPALVLTAKDDQSVVFTSGLKLKSGQTLLDYYDEGIFTPTFQDSSVSDAEGQTYSAQDGRWTRVGNTYFISGRIAATSFGTLTESAQIILAGMPDLTASGYRGGLTIDRCSAAGLSAGGEPLTLRLGSSNDIAVMYRWDSTVGTTALTFADVANTLEIEFHGQFEV